MFTNRFLILLSFGLVVLLGASTRADLTQSAVAVWLFDEGVGDTAKDSLNGHDGEIFDGVDWTADAMFGNALEFSGEPGSHVEVPHADELSLDTWTITAWVKLEPPLGGNWTIAVVKDPANGLQNYSLDMNPAGNVVAEVTSEGNWSDSVSTTPVHDEEWHFVAASYDGDVLQTFVDGGFESEQEFGPGDVNDAPLSIGDRLDGSQPIYGIIDDVGLFNEALGESDLLNVMNNGLSSAIGLDGAVLRAGDADQDLDFDQLDLVQVQIAAKYLTGQAATWGEGDWDGAPGGSPGDPPTGNGFFDQLDIIAALNASVYLKGPYAALKAGGTETDEQTSLVYDTNSGELKVDAPANKNLTSINITSAGSKFVGDRPASLDGAFDNFDAGNVFKATFGGSFGDLSLGNVLPAGLSAEEAASDLSAVGSLEGGGELGEVDFVYIPEPSSLALLALGVIAAFVARGRNSNSEL